MNSQSLLLALLAALGLTAGCNQSAVETGPSYAELVVIYNAELETLDRLEAKREKLVADFQAKPAPESNDGKLSLDGILESAKEFKEETGVNLTSDPNEVLEQLAERTGGAEKIAGDLIEGLLSKSKEPKMTPEEIAAEEERKADYEAKLAAIDDEIADQQSRVERARAARDAAEQKSLGN